MKQIEKLPIKEFTPFIEGEPKTIICPEILDIAGKVNQVIEVLNTLTAEEEECLCKISPLGCKLHSALKELYHEERECTCKSIGNTLAYLNDNCEKHGKVPHEESKEVDVEALLEEFSWNKTIAATTNFKENKDACEERNREILETITNALKK